MRLSNDERSVETGGDISTEHVFHTTVSSNVYNIIWYILYWTFCFRFNGCIQRSSFEFLFLLILSCLSELLFYAYPSLFVVCLNCYSVLALDFVLFLLIVIHSMLLPNFICIYPNCYSVLIIDLDLSIRMLFCASHYICLLCPNYCPCLSLT